MVHQNQKVILTCIAALLEVVWTEFQKPPASLIASTYKSRSAYETYQLLYKRVNFKISSKYPAQKYVHANYFVKYKKRPREELEDPENGNERYDGYLTFLVVGERGIYVKRIEERWIDYNTTKNHLQAMKPLKEFDSLGSTRIVSCQMNSNETILTVGYSNLTLEVYEIEQDANSVTDGYRLRTLQSYKLYFERIVEKQDKIRSIGAVPYSDIIIASPNRFDLFKMNRRANKIEKKKNPLDSTRFVVCPVATFRHADNPHSPTRVKRKWISDKNFNIGTDPRCILTGHLTPTNAVIDWTNMKTVAYWNLGLMGGSSKPQTNIIHSISFFGGIPEPSMYVFTPSRADQFIFLFDTITNRQIHRYPDYQLSHPKVVNWINGTLYVSVYVQEPTVGFPKGSQLIFLKIFGPTAYRAYNRLIEKMEDKDITNYAITRVFLEMGGREELDELEGLEDLDTLHLGYYMLPNLLVVEPPVIPFSRCRNKKAEKVTSNTLVKAETSDRSMLYGRYRFCNYCVPGFKRLTLEERDSSTKSLVTCQVMDCGFSQKTGINNERLKQLTQVVASIRPSTSLIGITVSKITTKCQEPHLIKENAAGLVNDDHCAPQTNRDYFGMCRRCNSKHSFSNCFFFTPAILIHEDYTLNIENYEASMYYLSILNPKIEGKFESYEKVYFYDESTKTYNSVSQSIRKEVRVWKHQQTPGSELCYRLDKNPSDPEGYSVLPARGFRLEPMGAYPWINTTKQKEKYPNGTLNTRICVKDCEVGYYYDFESRSCRKCDIGCADCKYFEQCSTCVPGYIKVQRPRFRGVEKGIKVGSCLVGCQKGFYRQRFNGNCTECPKGCEVCRDRSTEELLSLTALDMDQLGSRGFCSICERRPDGNQAKIVDEITGKCIDSCSGVGMVITKKRTNWFNEIRDYEYEICSRCHNSRCKKCSTAKPDGCVECLKSYFLERQEDGSLDCVKFNDHIVFSYIIFGSFGIFSALCLAVLLCLIKSSGEQARLKKKLKTSKKSHSKK